MNQNQLWYWMWEGKQKDEDRRAHAELARDTVVTKINLLDRDNPVNELWQAGKTVKVNMVSRFGDVGITDDFETHHGYHHRIACHEDAIKDKDREAGDLLVNVRQV